MKNIDETDRLTLAFTEGREAFLKGEHYNTNPHLDDSEEADEWDAGWGEADDENPGVFNHALDAFETS
jgi:ribosome modulation factor